MNCPSCRFDVDWFGRIYYAGCVRCDRVQISMPTPTIELQPAASTRKPARHGTTHMYFNHRCRCIPCRAAAAAWRRERKAVAA